MKELCKRGRQVSPTPVLQNQSASTFNWMDIFIEGKWYDVIESGLGYDVIGENNKSVHLSKTEFRVHFANIEEKRDKKIEEIVS